jgi:uncharacterized repeat protein (TIGR03943 family)
MRRDAQGVVLLVLGAAVLKVSVTGSYTRYVRPGFGPVLIVCAVILLMLGAVALRETMQDLRRAARGESTVDTEAGVRRTGWPLLAAALVALLLVPPAAGAYQAQRVSVVPVPTTGSTPLPAGDPVRLSLREYVARATANDGASLRDRVVTLTGFVLVAPSGRPYLARLTMGCCAGDARPIEVGLQGELPAGLADGVWVEVDGGFVDQRDRDPVSRAVIPYVAVTAVRAIAEPTDAYE